MKWDRFAIMTALAVLVLICALFVLVRQGGPSDIEQIKPAQAGEPGNNTNVDAPLPADVWILNASNVTTEPEPSPTVPTGRNSRQSSPLVLRILSVNNVSTGYESDYYNDYDVRVVRSNITAYTPGEVIRIQINVMEDGYWGQRMGVAPAELRPGTVIEVYTYPPDGGSFSIWVHANPDYKDDWDNAWKQEITVVQYPAV